MTTRDAIEGLLERVQTEADLCRNEGAQDIAKLLDEVAVALVALSRQQPSDMVLVPREPTEAMIDAFYENRRMASSDIILCYRAMLAAAGKEEGEG